MTSDTMLALATTQDNDGKTNLLICRLPSMAFSSTFTSSVSIAISIALDCALETTTMAQILPASFLSLGHSVYDSNDITFTCIYPEICTTYCMNDYSLNLLDAARHRSLIPIAYHHPLLASDPIYDACIIDNYVVTAQCPDDQGSNISIIGSIENIRSTQANPLTLETSSTFQITCIHRDPILQILKIDAWHGRVYLTLVGDSPIIHIYDFVD